MGGRHDRAVARTSAKRLPELRRDFPGVLDRPFRCGGAAGAGRGQPHSARKGLADPDPMVRIGALDMLDGLPGNRIWPLVSPLLTDSSRGVRVRAVSVLAGVPAANQPASDR